MCNMKSFPDFLKVITRIYIKFNRVPSHCPLPSFHGAKPPKLQGPHINTAHNPTLRCSHQSLRTGPIAGSPFIPRTSP